ncbi:DUF3307 domain-containing protein [Ascidiaceihabitans sp.]|uniref:DUF3307 domain-containing protein n=1 Tax=Ascidiaceihabitans sp. TaxID=1872644 RepID=UPI0032983FB3
MDQITLMLVMLALFQVKHLFADFYLQTPKMLSAGAIYVHVGRAQHAVVHVVGSFLVLLPFGLLAGLSWALVVGLLAVEWMLHYHIDFGKGWWSKRTAFTTTDAGYWRAFGMDQLAHQWTYIAMVWMAV